MNLSDIAREAGVSVATASKAFSGSREISEETRERIFAVARAAGVFDRYNKNRFKKRVFAVIAPELVSEYYGATLTMLSEEIAAVGGVMLTSMAGFNTDAERELFCYYADYCHADGIILLQNHVDHKNPSNTPAVAFSSKKRTHVDSIHIEIERPISEAIAHLKALGHTAIGFAGEHLTVSKEEAFRTAMRKAALPLPTHAVKVSNARFEAAGVEIAEKWLAEGTLPTAVLAAYDYIAIGIIKRLTEAGLRVPEDVSVIGMDDISTASYLPVALSSIATNTARACHEAVSLLVKQMDNQYYRTRERIVIPSTFIPRASSGRVKKEE